MAYLGILFSVNVKIVWSILTFVSTVKPLMSCGNEEVVKRTAMDLFYAF